MAAEHEEKQRLSAAAAKEAAVEADRVKALKSKQKERKEANQKFTLSQVQTEHSSAKVREKWLKRKWEDVTPSQWMTMTEALMHAPCQCSCKETGECPICLDSNCYVWCKGCYSWQHYCCSESTLPSQVGVRMQKPKHVPSLKMDVCPMPDCQKEVSKCECYQLCYECRLVI